MSTVLTNEKKQPRLNVDMIPSENYQGDNGDMEEQEVFEPGVVPVNGMVKSLNEFYEALWSKLCVLARNFLA